MLLLLLQRLRRPLRSLYKVHYPRKYKERADFLEDLIIGLAGLDRNGAADMASPSSTPSTNPTEYVGFGRISLADKRTGYHYIDELPMGKPGSKCANCKHHHNKPKE